MRWRLLLSAAPLRRCCAAAARRGRAPGATCRWQSSWRTAEFVPFRLTEDDAINVFRMWAEQQWLAPEAVRSVTHIHELRAVLLPFWACDVSTRTKAEATVGKVVWGFKTDAKGRVQPHAHTVWQHVRLPANIQSRYSSDLPEMQIYASHTFKRANVQVLKLPLSAVGEHLTQSVVQGPEIDVWSMHREHALERISKQLDSSESRIARDHLLRFSSGSSIKNLKTDVKFQCSFRRVYFPAYIIGFSHLGRHFRCFVNGFDGRIDGLQQFSALKVALAVGLPVTLLLQAVQASLSLGVFLSTVIIPSLLLGLGARFLPIWQQRQREEQRKREQDVFGTFRADGETDEDYRDRQHNYQRSQRYQQEYGGATSVKAIDRPLYGVLGVQPSATLDDISRAFRAKALLWHPDVHNHASDKKHAAMQFKRIVAAYRVLRDPKKRAEYDRTGTLT